MHLLLRLRMQVMPMMLHSQKVTIVLMCWIFHKSHYSWEINSRTSLDLSLSHDDLLDVSCDQDELYAHASVLHASAENKHVMHIAS
jgi:hypothetical protein